MLIHFPLMGPYQRLPKPLTDLGQTGTLALEFPVSMIFQTRTVPDFTTILCSGSCRLALGSNYVPYQCFLSLYPSESGIRLFASSVGLSSSFESFETRLSKNFMIIIGATESSEPVESVIIFHHENYHCLANGK